jgi:hypothetical protein
VADVLYKSPEVVVLKVKVPRQAFDALEAAYGSQGRALRAFREDLPNQFTWLALEAPFSPRPDRGADAAPPARGGQAQPPPRGGFE